MAQGPGVYDHEATCARVACNARAVTLIVIGGDRGGGFAVQVNGASQAEAAELTLAMSRALRAAADSMERDARHILRGDYKPQKPE
jgi:hypothetical protein